SRRASCHTPPNPMPNLIETTLTDIAHGGHCVARHEGRVIFVRHGIPGERVRVRLTESGEGARFWRSDVAEVLEPSEARQPHFWPQADASRAYEGGVLPVGGAEFGHIRLSAQRELKAQVFEAQLRRIGGLEQK